MSQELLKQETNRVEIEKKEILNRYKSLLRACRYELDKEDKKLIRNAFDIALDAHKNMRRKSGEPYIYHPIAVAKIAAQEIGLGATSIACSLLHDVVEDSDYTLEFIEKKFGKKIASIIKGLTKISGVFDHSDSMQAENFRKMLLTLSDDVRVILIKLADRLHNMRTLDSMSRKNQLKIASETLYLYAPLAHRLGLYAIKTELEDLSIKYTERELYTEIAKKLSSTKASRSKYIKKFIEPIREKLEEQSLQFEIKGRPKSIYSILKKMRKQGIPFEEVYDLFAVRVILDSQPEEEKAACWHVYSIVTDIYHPNPKRLRDWISTPKSNGYESLHTTVMGHEGKWVEVQIRSKRMDEVAEKGYAAHWKYKNVKDGTATQNDAGLDEWLSKIKDILENPDPNALEFLDDFKLNLFNEEIFVFTPKGDLRKLPQNATALDFAFDIHTAVGTKCIGAKVNSKLVPFSHKLSNGDQVEILTSDKQKPKEEWLNIVVTGKAKARIRHTLKEESRLVAEEGKSILERKFRNARVEMTEDALNQIVTFFKQDAIFDLYFSVGKGLIAKDKINIREILAYRKAQSLKAPAKTKTPIPAKEKQSEIVVGDDADLQYSLAKCCNPIPGDDIFGFVTIGEGIKIHRTNCPNATRLMSNYGYRIIKAQWKQTPYVSEKGFLVGIKITGIDDVGIISRITDIISKQLQVNMKSITVESHDGTFEGIIKLYIYDTKHLDELKRKIEATNQFMKVIRIDV